MEQEPISMANLQESKGRNPFEIWLNKYNHIMEFIRTILAFTTLGLQLIILYRLTN